LGSVEDQEGNLRFKRRRCVNSPVSEVPPADNYKGLIFPTPVLFTLIVGLPLYKIFPTPERVPFKVFVAHIFALPAPESLIVTF